MGKQWKQWQSLFWGAPKSLQMMTVAMKLKDICPLEEKLWQLTQHIKKQRHCFANKGPSSQRHGFYTSHVWMWLWTIKKAEHLRIDGFELWCWRRLLRVPWIARRSKQSIIKEISPEYSLGRTDAEGETSILWPPDVKNWLLGKGTDAQKDWRLEEKGMTEDEMVGWHHRLEGYEFE